MPLALIIDDEPLLAKALAGKVSSLLPTFVVAAFTDPALALACIDSDSGHTIKLMIVDLSMPEISGEELIRRVLSGREYLRGKIIVCTGGLGSVAQEERLCKTLGCTRLGKPFEPEELASVVREATGHVEPLT